MNNQKIAVLTYDRPHRKTQDLVFRLVASGYSDITLVLMPWVDRPPWKPLIRHRPENRLSATPRELAKRFFLRTARFGNGKDLGKYDKILIGGAGIITGEALDNLIINSHPGYLPNVRGLDALKWAIYNGQPIGVTTHFIGPKPDSGFWIQREIIPVTFYDSFHSIAEKVYQTEIKMLVDAIELTNKEVFFNPIEGGYKVCGRMPKALEPIMLARFDALRLASFV